MDFEKFKEKWIKEYSGYEDEDNENILNGTLTHVRNNTKINMRLDMTAYRGICGLAEEIKNLKADNKLEDVQERIDWYNSKNMNCFRFLDGAQLSHFDLSSISTDPAKCLHLNCSLVHAECIMTNFTNSDLSGCVFEYSNIESSECTNCRFVSSKLYLCFATGTNFHNADFTNADLTSCNFSLAKIAEANFDRAILTNLYYRVYSSDDLEKINFYGSNYNSARLTPAIISFIEYNMKKNAWEKWYEEHNVLKYPVKLFWKSNDYGYSVLTLIKYLSYITLFFSGIYFFLGFYLFNIFDDIDNRNICGQAIRSIYFSVITMTTVGFGDIIPKATSFWGHFIIIIQSILGYVSLGSLITIIGILFTTAGIPVTPRKYKE